MPVTAINYPVIRHLLSAGDSRQSIGSTAVPAVCLRSTVRQINRHLAILAGHRLGIGPSSELSVKRALTCLAGVAEWSTPRGR